MSLALHGMAASLLLSAERPQLGREQDGREHDGRDTVVMVFAAAPPPVAGTTDSTPPAPAVPSAAEAAPGPVSGPAAEPVTPGPPLADAAATPPAPAPEPAPPASRSPPPQPALSRPAPPQLQPRTARRQAVEASRPVAGGRTEPSSPAPSTTTASAALTPATTAPPAAPSVDPSWRGALNGWLLAHRRYPELARERGQQGVVGVTFRVDKTGQVLAVSVTRSSGASVLDDAVRTMLQGQRVPAFPAVMALAETNVTVDIRYTLD